MADIPSMLKEGQISDAENSKLKLEQAQRERRHQAEQEGASEQAYHTPMWFQRKDKVILSYFTDLVLMYV